MTIIQGPVMAYVAGSDGQWIYLGEVESVSADVMRQHIDDDLIQSIGDFADVLDCANSGKISFPMKLTKAGKEMFRQLSKRRRWPKAGKKSKPGHLRPRWRQIAAAKCKANYFGSSNIVIGESNTLNWVAGHWVVNL